MSPFKDRRSMSFSSDCEDAMEESSVMSNLSPPRSCRKARIGFGLGGACESPKTRRLFEEDADADRIVKKTPYRRSLKPSNLNDESGSLSLDSTEPASGRKRPPLGRSNQPSYYYNHNSRQMDTSISDDSPDVTMYASPHMSPNSFWTMDGRFVQSKNPFSSPMMDDTPLSSRTYNALLSSTKAAPSLPVTFPSSSAGESKLPSVLPPRRFLHQAAATGSSEPRTPASDALQALSPKFRKNGGYPEPRFSFTGSPIMEAAYEAAAMESGMASAGSLHKVRRLNLCDDVVSATAHDLFNRRPKSLSVRTSSDGNNKFSDWMAQEQGVSPTDVIDFPPPTPSKRHAPPPTPMKSKTKPSENLYNSIRRSNQTTPGPPVLERRRPARTPHPGSFFHGENDDDCCENQGPKSRFYSDFDVIGELGEGSFGTVYKVLSRLDGCMYAIKAAQRKAKGPSDRDRMLKEVYALAALSDQADTANFHIVRYHQAWMEDDRLYIQTEMCMCTLSEEVERGVLEPEKRRYKLLREMLLALNFIHRNSMVHLDIKPDNIFIKNDQYKLGDFGLVTKLSAQQDVEEGDSRYMSMELLSGDKSDLRKSDIFSLGATMYEICLRRNLPMNGQEWQDIRAGKLSPLPDTGTDMVDIIRQMMDPKADQRPTPTDLLQHPQLLSEEQKALNAAKSKVARANMQLVAQEKRFQRLAPSSIQRRGLTRANTWNGTTALPYL